MAPLERRAITCRRLCGLTAWTSAVVYFLEPRVALVGRSGIGATSSGFLRRPALDWHVVNRAASSDGSPDSGPSPEAWRDFRAQLISSGLKLTTDEDGQEKQGASEEPSSRSSVAPKNEELLREQNEALWNEYMNGAWAHASPVEAGGLMCRLPLQAQLTYLMRQGNASKSRWGDVFRDRLLTELPAPEEGGRTREEMLETWSQNPSYCYRLAETVIDEMLTRVKEAAPTGRVDASKLNKEDLELLLMYGSQHETWQAVCLVLSAEAGVAKEAVTINRPLAGSMNERLASLLLNGDAPSTSTYSIDVVRKCAKAFADECAVYLGGPKRQDEPGLLVHGFPNLSGAVELAPGSRIYVGGHEAAIDGVLNGTFKPLDFRWFVGKHTGLTAARGEWLPVACSRPVALKQCLGLPKPLWHEVMELCGGENADWSRLEIVKRDDIEDE